MSVRGTLSRASYFPLAPAFRLHDGLVMDTLTLFLMHTLGDLQITEEDLLALLNLAPPDPRSLEEVLISSRAREFVREKSDWYQESLRLHDESEKAGLTWCRFGEVDYPRLWLSLSQKPLIFHFRGEPLWRRGRLLAVVGSRTPMHETKMWMQRELGKFLRLNPVGVVSGGARGVDQWAHRLSMDCRRPTVCVLPAGVMRPYPPGSEEFMNSIVREGGCLLSTFHPFEDMRKHNFHIRNRWIAGLSKLCLVVEANRRSGSSLTAMLAKAESRALATIPVHPHSEQGLANLDLIYEGAAIIRDHLDLATAWNLNSGPDAFDAFQGEQEEQNINEPQGDGGGQPAVTGDRFSRQIEHPI
jgi:DNA processing protein